jgi:hypothetical protein
LSGLPFLPFISGSTQRTAFHGAPSLDGISHSLEEGESTSSRCVGTVASHARGHLAGAVDDPLGGSLALGDVEQQDLRQADLVLRESQNRRSRA